MQVVPCIIRSGIEPAWHGMLRYALSRLSAWCVGRSFIGSFQMTSASAMTTVNSHSLKL